MLEVDPPGLTLGSNAAVLAGAVAGLGVALASRDLVAHHLSAGELVTIRVPGSPLRRPWHAVGHRQAPRTVGLFVSHLLSGAAMSWQRPDVSPAGSTTRGS